MPGLGKLPTFRSLMRPPLARNRHQRYVFMARESAANYPTWFFEDDFYNWTMSYRRDSDLYLPYGRIEKIREHPSGQALERLIAEFGQKNRHLAAKKKGFKAAWFVSNCRARGRRMVADALTNYMQVDINGICGRHTCPKSNRAKCFQAMAEEYKFYLSFENTICDDYVTEKFFNILHYNVIPVTLGGADYSQIAPPHSYVNVLDFASLRGLAAHLRRLHEDDAKFAEYFWWRDYYETRKTGNFVQAYYCEICRRLHNPEEEAKSSKDNFSQWWERGWQHVKSINQKSMKINLAPGGP